MEENPLYRKLDHKYRLNIPKEYRDKLNFSNKGYLTKSRLVEKKGDLWLPVLEYISQATLNEQEIESLENKIKDNSIHIKAAKADVNFKFNIPTLYRSWAKLNKEAGLYLNSENSVIIFPLEELDKFYNIKASYDSFRTITI